MVSILLSTLRAHQFGCSSGSISTRLLLLSILTRFSFLLAVQSMSPSLYLTQLTFSSRLVEIGGMLWKQVT